MAGSDSCCLVKKDEHLESLPLPSQTAGHVWRIHPYLINQVGSCFHWSTPYSRHVFMYCFERHAVAPPRRSRAQPMLKTDCSVYHILSHEWYLSSGWSSQHSIAVARHHLFVKDRMTSIQIAEYPSEDRVTAPGNTGDLLVKLTQGYSTGL